MSQRTLAGVLAVPLLIALWAVAIFAPLPYVTYEPGMTVDVLGSSGGEEIVQVDGRRTYRDEGELHLTTVLVSRPQTRINLFEVMTAWIDPDAAVLPYAAVYPDNQTAEESEAESAMQMTSSQDTATALALTELGYEVSEVVEVLQVTEGLPADGLLKVRDILLQVGGTEITTAQDVVTAVDAAAVDEPLEFVILRGGKEKLVLVTPKMVEGDKRVGIAPGPGYRFPFDVSVQVDPNIGGPSAGLVFALSIYDTLTPGSMTGGQVVAGTGTVDEEGNVGAIGGVQQKIAAARDTGAEIFLVPPGNCKEALLAPRGDMELVRAETMHVAVETIEAWAEDPDTDLPSCETDESESQ